MTTVLVVEDEIEIARVVRDYLRNAGFEVIVVGDGGSAVASVRSAKPDLLVLDLGLPGRDGLDVAREIRRWSDTPIVMLTARGDETDRIVGLEIGADDYVVKPFAEGARRARRAVLRRTRAAARGDEVVRAGDVEIDTAKARERGGTHVDLTPTDSSSSRPSRANRNACYTVPAARRGPRRCDRVLRTRDRRPREEHPAGRSSPTRVAPVRRHGPRRRYRFADA